MDGSSQVAYVQSHSPTLVSPRVRPGENQLRCKVRSVQYFSCLFPVIWSEAFGGTGLHPYYCHQCFPSIWNCIFSQSEMSVLLRLHVRSNPISGSYSRDLAPKDKTLEHMTPRLLNFSNLTLSHSDI